MNKLRQHHCGEVGTTTRLSDSEIREHLGELDQGWTVSNNHIQRKFAFQDFDEAMFFVNEVAALAESEDHHPDMHVSYRTVVIELWTHDVDGLSLNDFILASKIETCV